MSTDSLAAPVHHDSDEEIKVLLSESEAPQSLPATKLLLRKAVRAGIALGLACGFLVAVRLWMQGQLPMKKLRGTSGDSKLTVLELEHTGRFACSGDWPVPWFEDSWKAYCAGHGHKVWAMTSACNHAGFCYGHHDMNDAENQAMRGCRENGQCYLFDIDGDKCPDSRHPRQHPPKSPHSVIMGPPFRGAFKVMQCPSHVGINRDAVDFRMPTGTQVIAARPGTVVHIEDGHGDGGVCKDGKDYITNFIAVQNEDGTQDQYMHLLNGTILVKKGDSVTAGQDLALSGKSGCASEPHLHILTLAPTFDKSVPTRWVFPCGTSDFSPVTDSRDGIVAKTDMFFCNEHACKCISPFCKPPHFPNHEQVHQWKKFCNATENKSWFMDNTCSKSVFRHGTNASSRAQRHCGPTCCDFSNVTLGVVCPYRALNGSDPHP